MSTVVLERGREETQPGQAEPLKRFSLPDVYDDVAWAGTPLADAESWERADMIAAYDKSGDISFRADFFAEQRVKKGLQPISQIGEIAELASQIEAKAREMFPTLSVRG